MAVFVENQALFCYVRPVLRPPKAAQGLALHELRAGGREGGGGGALHATHRRAAGRLRSALPAGLPGPRERRQDAAVDRHQRAQQAQAARAHSGGSLLSSGGRCTHELNTYYI